jgi:hypothetical protein
MQLCTVQAGKSVSPRPSSSSRPIFATSGLDSNIYSTCSIAAWTKGCNLVDCSSSLMAETPGGCTPCRLAKESCPGPHARDDATSGHDSNVLRLSSDLIGPVEPRGYDGTRYLIGFTKEFINWLDMQDFKDKHTTRRLHLDNDTFIQDHEL